MGERGVKRALVAIPSAKGWNYDYLYHPRQNLSIQLRERHFTKQNFLGSRKLELRPNERTAWSVAAYIRYADGSKVKVISGMRLAAASVSEWTLSKIFLSLDYQSISPAIRMPTGFASHLGLARSKTLARSFSTK